MDPITTTYVETRCNRDGEARAYLSGTRIRVQDVYVLSELQGKTADEIVGAYPQLSLAQVHGALAYCFDHIDEIREEIRQDQDFMERFRQTTGPGPLEKKLRGVGGDADSISS